MSFFAIVVNKGPLDVLVITDGVLVEFADGRPKRRPGNYMKLIRIPNSDPSIIVTTGFREFHTAISEAVRQGNHRFETITDTLSAMEKIIIAELSAYPQDSWGAEWFKANHVVLQYSHSGDVLHIGSIKVNFIPGRIEVRRPAIPESLSPGVIWWPEGCIPQQNDDVCCIIQTPLGCPKLLPEFRSILENNRSFPFRERIPLLLRDTKVLLNKAMEQCIRVNDGIFYAIASDGFQIKKYREQ